ncbi:radical SAM protein [bacterium]|nr:radical SAM protein [bacterium]
MGMKERPLQTKIIYGPVDSRRLGRSLGVNILPTQWKVCTFDCLYCQYGWTCCNWEGPESVEHLGLPTPEEVAEALEAALPALGPVDAVTLAGNGEPTLHPRFEPTVRLVAAVRDRLAPGVPLVILSNSSTITAPEVRRAFRLIDRPVMKLDAGSPVLFDQINRPRPGIEFDKVVEALAALERVEIQSLFFDGPLSNCGPRDIELWLAALTRIRPQALQVYSLDRTPAESRLKAVPRERLEQIADSARDCLPGMKVAVF